MKDIRGIIKFIKTMRVLRGLLLAGLIVFILVFIALHIFINAKAKPFVTQKLRQAFKKEISVGSLSTSLPLNIHIKDIRVEGLCSIKEIVAGGASFNISRNCFSLASLKIIKPEITAQRNLPNQAVSAAVAQGENQEAQAAPAAAVTGQNPEVQAEPAPANITPLAQQQNELILPRFLVKRLNIHDGVVNFTDKISQDQAITIKVTQVNLRLDNLNFSGRGDQITYFKFSGSVPWRETQGAGKIEGEGWINLFRKDIQATLKIHDIDGIYLYPYYSKWVDLEKVRVESAKLNFESNIHGLNNDVSAACHLELTAIVRKERAPEETQDKAEKIADIALGIFKALDQGKIELNFTIKTKMNMPQFGIEDIRSAVEEKLTKARAGEGLKAQDVLMLPGNILTGAVKSVTDLSKAVIGGAFAAGNEMKKAVEDSFRKESK